MKKDKTILKLLSPSWLVSFFGITAALLVPIGVIIMTNYESSALRFQIFDVQSRSIVDQQGSLYATISTDARESSFLGTLPLLITWACIGLLVYFFATSIIKVFGKAANVHEELGYVNASKQGILKQTFVSLAIRLAATLGWFLFIKLTIAVLVPYALASSSAAASGFSLQSIGYIALAAIILYATVLGHAIFLRLVLLKPRVFSR